MAGFGGSSSSPSKAGKKSKKNKKQSGSSKSGGDQFDVSAALLRSEKLYDKMTIESAKSMSRDDDDDDDATAPTGSDDDNNLLSEFLVAARRSSSSSQQQLGSSSVSDWTPVAQVCLLRSRSTDNANGEDGRIPAQLVEAVSAHCREIHHAAVVSAPVFSSLPRTEIQYSVEPIDSFHKFVYDAVLDDGREKNKKTTSDLTSSKEARAVLGVEAGCNDLSVIKKAYRSLSFQNHPDRFSQVNTNDDNNNEDFETRKMEAKEIYTRVKDAYEFLQASGVTASSDNNGSGLSWYESLGGRERTDFKGPLELIQIKEAQRGMERCLKTEGGYRSAVTGLDPEMVMNFIARNQANAAVSR